MKSQPLVSIIMPVYNSAEFIAETVATIHAQTYANWELVVVDDGSTDDTKKVLDSCGLTSSQLQYYHTGNRGPGAARNLAISHAKGELIAFLDADDLWSKDKLQKQTACMQEQQCDFVLSSGQFLGGPAGAVFATAVGKYSGEEMFKLLYQHNRIPVVSVLTKKHLVQSVGGFKEQGLLSRKCEDYDLWMRLAAAGTSFYGMADKLVTYRIHANSAAGQTTIILEADFLVVEQFNSLMQKSHPNLYRSRMRDLYNRLAASYSVDGHKDKAIKAMNSLSSFENSFLVTIKKVLLRLGGAYYGKVYQLLS